jgi:choline dehydrogenase-like flavoprotein
LLSGIGPKKDLEQHSIPVVLDAPRVGQNFHDHLEVLQWWKLRNPAAGLAMGSPAWTNPAYFRGVPCDWYVCQQTPPQQLRSALAKDVVQDVDHHQLLFPDSYHAEAFVIYAPAAPQAQLDVPFDGSIVTSFVLGMTPTSRGTVKLASASPSSPPLVDPNGYSIEVDRCSMREGIR